MNLNEQYIGKFWIPENAEETVVGVLEFKENGIYLKCYGKLAGTDYMFDDYSYHKPLSLVNGETRNTECVTLVNLRLHSFGYTSNRWEVNYSIETVLGGDYWLLDVQAKIYQYHTTTYGLLNNFVGKPTIDVAFKEDDLTINAPKIPHIDIINDESVHTYLWHNSSTCASGKIDSFFQWNTQFKVRKSFDELIIYKEAIDSFFAIILGDFLSPTDVKLMLENREVNLYTNRILTDELKRAKQSSVRGTLVRFNELEELSFTPYTMWMSNYASISHSVNLYLDALRNYAGQTPQNFFLNMFYANETLLRFINTNARTKSPVPSDVEKIIAKYNMKQNDAAKLRSKFNKKSYTTLDYFKKLDEMMPDLVSKLFGQDSVIYYKTIKDTRDKIVHQTEPTTKNVIDNETDLRKAATKLRILYQALCLYYMGFGSKAETMVFRSAGNYVF